MTDTAAPDPRAVGAHDCPRCGEPYNLDGCACPTTTAACNAVGPDDRVCVLPPRHEGFHASRWGSEADFWLREAAMATAVRPHTCCDCPKQEPPLPCCNLGHDTGWVTVDGYRAEVPS